MEVVISLGSNMGKRLRNLTYSLKHLSQHQIQVVLHSCLYETEPIHYVDQPKFLNAAVLCKTHLDPLSLLRALKCIESNFGRTKGEIRFGPRPLDMDIIFYGNQKIDYENLQIPHIRWMERDFVKAPLKDLHGLYSSITTGCYISENKVENLLNEVNFLPLSESDLIRSGIKRVYALSPEKIAYHGGRTLIIGILNITPDSFSDGGKHLCENKILKSVESFIKSGCDIIDIGGQSTRPGSEKIEQNIEINRVIPVIRKIKDEFGKSDNMPLISVDTYYAGVASEAVKEGASIVNDISSGELDQEMFKTVADLGVPYVMMHMRGTPATMTSLAHYTDLCQELGGELKAKILAAMQQGIPAWNIILDPGIGFAKNFSENIELIRNIENLRKNIFQGSCKHMPILVGPSRKRFLGEIIGKTSAAERDAATCAVCVECVRGGVDIVRVHNVEMATDAVKVADALYKSI